MAKLYYISQSFKYPNPQREINSFHKLIISFFHKQKLHKLPEISYKPKEDIGWGRGF